MDNDQPGVGVMIGILMDDGTSADVYRKAVGKTIRALALENNTLRFVFTDGWKMSVVDDGQSCCESRYMSTDDELSDYVGGTLLSIEVREAPNAPAEYDTHEVQFLVVNTSKGSFTMANHNEHNGYYGGFYIKLLDMEPED